MAIGSGLSLIGQMQQASAQADYQDELARQNYQVRVETAQAANASFVEQNAQENLRLQQEAEATAIQKQDLQREALQRVGTAVASSEGAGLSLASTVRDINRTLGTAGARLDRNLEMSRLQSGFRVDSYRAQAIDRARSIQPYVPQPIQQPDYLGAIADIGKVAFNSYERRQRGLEGDSNIFNI